MAKPVALVDRPRPLSSDDLTAGLQRARFRAPLGHNPLPLLERQAGWLRGIIRARQQFRDDDRKAALTSAALGYELEAWTLHTQADQHETAMLAACRELGRIG